MGLPAANRYNYGVSGKFGGLIAWHLFLRVYSIFLPSFPVHPVGCRLGYNFQSGWVYETHVRHRCAKSPIDNGASKVRVIQGSF
jgi:hypothetical protein